jgi:hypothetical protein
MKIVLVLHHLLSFVLLALYFTNESQQFKKSFHYQKSPEFLLEAQKSTNKLSADHSNFINALVFGNFKQLNKELKLKVNKLNLAHALTPSGLHVSLLHPLLLLIPSTFIITIIYFVLFLFFHQLDFYYALERCLLYYLLININKKLKLNKILIFYLTFIVSFCLGSYHASPLSFLFSFIFWGIIIYSKNFDLKTKLIHLFIGNLIINYFFKMESSLLFFVFNPVLSLILSFSFLSSTLFLLTDFTTGLTYICDINLNLINICHSIFQNFPVWNSISILLIIIVLNSKRKIFFCISLLFFLNSSLNLNEKIKFKEIKYGKIIRSAY